MLRFLLIVPVLMAIAGTALDTQMAAIHPRLGTLVLAAALALFATGLALAASRLVRGTGLALGLMAACAMVAWYAGTQPRLPAFGGPWWAFAAAIIVFAGALWSLAAQLLRPWSRRRAADRAAMRFDRWLRPPGFIDLPGGPQVMARMARYQQLARWLGAVALAALLSGAAHLLGLPAAAVAGLALATLALYAARHALERIAPWFERHAGACVAVLSVVLTLALAGLMLAGGKQPAWAVLAGAAVAVALCLLLSPLLGKLLYFAVCALLLPLLCLPAAIDALRRPMAALLGPLFAHDLRQHHRAWLGEGQRPLISLTRVLQPDWKVFVVREAYLGEAMRDRGVPRFSARELATGWNEACRQSQAVLGPPAPATASGRRTAAMATAAGAAGALLVAGTYAGTGTDTDTGMAATAPAFQAPHDDGWDAGTYASDPFEMQWINPGSGLPTVDNMAGSPDIAGNSWGENHW